MSRTIKLRYWHKKTEDMVSPERLTNLPGVMESEDPEGVLMEYTGRVDTNGKEIFEGDLVKYKGDTGEVIWEDCRWILKKRGIMDLSLPMPLGHISGNNLLIVGNIYQNPDL